MEKHDGKAAWTRIRRWPASRPPASAARDAEGRAPRRRRATTPEARRAEILAAALEEFTARGFEATRLDDVARRAGIAKGTIYLYFADKETLFQELVRSMVNPVLGTLEAAAQRRHSGAHADRGHAQHLRARGFWGRGGRTSSG